MNYTKEDGYKLISEVNRIWQELDNIPRNDAIEHCASCLIIISFALKHSNMFELHIHCDLHSIDFIYDEKFIDLVFMTAYTMLERKVKYLPLYYVEEYFSLLMKLKSLFKDNRQHYRGSI